MSKKLYQHSWDRLVEARAFAWPHTNALQGSKQEVRSIYFRVVFLACIKLLYTEGPTGSTCCSWCPQPPVLQPHPTHTPPAHLCSRKL